MPREAALWILEEVLERKRPFDEALARDHRMPGLEPRDRAFARLLTTTTLRRLGQIDDIIAGCMKRPLSAKSHRARNILRLGVCQIEFLDVAAYAAVDTAVRLVEKPQSKKYKGLINGVLRRVERAKKQFSQKQDPAKLNTPTWLWESWSTAYGEEVCREIAETHLQEPPLDLTVAREIEHWRDSLNAKPVFDQTLRLTHAGPVPALPGYAEGAWWVQDAAATLPAKFLAPRAGQTAVDLCAAPGGKTAQLAVSGTTVIAVDRSQQRMQVLQENMHRLRLDVETIVAEAEDWEPPAPVDMVLLDAPCSATGTIRRHPDIATIKEPNDVIVAAATQWQLLGSAIKMLRLGGRLVYSVCSLETAEGEEQIAALLDSTSIIRRDAIRADEVWGLTAGISPLGEFRTLPNQLNEQGGLDGFYIARLIRTA